MLQMLATCCPGLENILSDEIMEKLAVPATVRRGAAYFSIKQPQDALQLGCADNIYVLIGAAAAGPHRVSLPNLGIDIARLPIARVCEQLGLPFHGVQAHVSASRSGKHSYSRFEAAAAVLNCLTSSLPLLGGTADAHDLAFRLDITGDKAEFSVKLTGADFRFRGSRVFSPAAIRPTIAQAMVRLTNPAPDDVFLDPFCGSGTLLCERLATPYAQAIGSDLDGTSLTAARENTGGRATLENWDACAMKLEAASVSAIATNPPWGLQIALEDEGKLYTGFMGEAKRVLVPGGRLVVLTDRSAAMEQACITHGLQLPTPITLSLHGTLCYCYRFLL